MRGTKKDISLTNLFSGLHVLSGLVIWYFDPHVDCFECYIDFNRESFQLSLCLRFYVKPFNPISHGWAIMTKEMFDRI